MMRSCLASEKTISQFLSPTLSMPFHLYYSGHMAKDTCSCPEPSASPNRLWVNGKYRAFTSHQSARGRRFLTSMKAINTQLEILWLSSSSLERWVLISITGKILSGLRICLNRAQTHGIHFGGSFSSHTKFYFFISLQNFQHLPFPSQTRPRNMPWLNPLCASHPPLSVPKAPAARARHLGFSATGHRVQQF